MRPGLRVGEALARCPRLDLVVPDPDAAAEAAERTLERLEGVGLRGGADRPRRRGVRRPRARCACTAGSRAVLRRVRAALPVGADGRVGAAPVAVRRPPGRPRGGARAAAGASTATRCAEFLAPLPAGRLPLAPDLVTALHDLGLRTMGQVAALPRAAALERLGFPGLRAWRLARRRARPRPAPAPPAARRCARPSPSPSRWGPCRPSRPPPGCCWASSRRRRAAAARPCARSRCARAWPTAGRGRATLALREATADPDRLALGGPPAPRRDHRPGRRAVDRRRRLGGGRRAISSRPSPRPPRSGAPRAREAIRQVRAAQGPEAMLRAVEIEPWSRLPERRWALTPYEP